MQPTVTAPAPTVSLDNPKIGDLVGVDHHTYWGRTYRVTKVNPKTVVLVEVLPDGIVAARSLKAPRTMLTNAPVAGAASNRPAAELVPFDTTPMPVLGTVVTLNRPAGLFVVVGFHGDKARVALLGGDGNRYVRNVAARSMTVVALADLPARLA